MPHTDNVIIFIQIDQCRFKVCHFFLIHAAVGTNDYSVARRGFMSGRTINRNDI